MLTALRENYYTKVRGEISASEYSSVASYRIILIWSVLLGYVPSLQVESDRKLLEYLGKAVLPFTAHWTLHMHTGHCTLHTAHCHHQAII